MSSGTFEGLSDLGASEIVLNSGQIVHATAGPLSGETALFAILGSPTTQFSFNPGMMPSPQTIRRAWRALLSDFSSPPTPPPAAMSIIPMQNHLTSEVFRDPDVLEAVQFSEDGTPLAVNSEDPETLQATFVYIQQLAAHIGIALGTDGLKEIQIACAEKKAVCTIGSESTTVLVTGPKANIPILLRKLA